MRKVITLYRGSLDDEELDELTSELSMDYDLNRGEHYEVSSGEPRNPPTGRSPGGPALEIEYPDAAAMEPVCHAGWKSITTAANQLSKDTSEIARLLEE